MSADSIRAILVVMTLFIPAPLFADHVLNIFVRNSGKIAVHAVETDFVHGFHRDYIYYIDALKRGKPSPRKYLIPDKDFNMLRKHQETEIYNDEREDAIKKNYEALEKAGYSQASPAKLTGDLTFSFNGSEYSLNISLKKDFQHVFLKKAGEKRWRQVFKLKNEKSWKSGGFLRYKLIGIRELYIFSAGGKDFAAIILKTNTPVELHNPHLEYLIVVKL